MRQFFLVLSLLLALPCVAQAKIYILIEEASSRKFPIAVPEVLTVNGGQNSFTRQITSLIKKDLAIAGIFKVLDEDSFVQSDQDVRTINFEKWTSIEAHALVKGIVEANKGKYLIELRLYDTSERRLLVGKQYVVEKKNYASAVHRFLDELMQSLTGKRGPFASRIVAACGKQGRKQIQYFSVDGVVTGGVTNNKSNNISPNWSPDGSQIAFTSFLKYYPEIYSIGSDGSKLRQLTNNKATNITPAYSPSGKAIAFSSSRGGDTEIYLMGRSGKLIGRVTKTLNIDVSPSWSPDGSQIVFASERAGNLHLFVSPASGGGGARLTYTGYQNDQPDWSSDGDKIVFTARDRGAFDIFVMNSDGSLIQRLTREEGNNESPTWSPDSRYISFSSSRGGLYVMLADGSNQTSIPNTGGCINPDWGPWMKL